MQISILEYLEKRPDRRDTGKPAVVDRERAYSFAELEDCAKRCAALLIARADVFHQPIAVYLPKCAGVVFADIGIVYSGNVYMNLDVKSPAQWIQAIIGNIRPVLIVTSRELAPQLEAMGIAPERIFLIEPIFDERVAFDSGALWRRLSRVIDTDPLCIINTSGSTGVPKGVVLNHRSTINFVDQCLEVFGFDGSERIGSLSPFYFDLYTLELNLCLARGSTIVIIPEELAIFPAKLLELLQQQAISFLFWVPSILVNVANRGLLGEYDLSALRTVFFAGEVLPTKHLNQWRRAAPQARFVNLYGPIEITVDCTYYIVEREFADNEPLPLCYPFLNTDILILNDDNRLCGANEQGEICVRGSSLAMGYWNDPEKTARAFVQNPLNPHYPDIVYRTGDLGWRDERGLIYFAGRKDFQIKHLGYRIELPEIEHQVLCLDGITNACVLYNQTKKEITLFYEAVDGAWPPAAIRKRLAEIFPKYMLPTAFHHVEELPRNPNGKIDRNGLRLQLEAQTA